MAARNPMFVHATSVAKRDVAAAKKRTEEEEAAKARIAPIALPADVDPYEVLDACASKSSLVSSLLHGSTEFTGRNVHRLDVSTLQPLKLLGEGTFGRVWLACDRDLKGSSSDSHVPLYAVKQMDRVDLIEAKQLRRACRELRILSRFKEPFLLPIHGRDADERFIYLILHAGTGGSMCGLLDRVVSDVDGISWGVSGDEEGSDPPRTFGGLPIHWARFLTACMVDAINALHNEGIANRDIKPDNVVFDVVTPRRVDDDDDDDGGGWCELWPLLLDYGFSRSYRQGDAWRPPTSHGIHGVKRAGDIDLDTLNDIKRLGAPPGHPGAAVHRPCCDCACFDKTSGGGDRWHSHGFHTLSETLVHMCRVVVERGGTGKEEREGREGGGTSSPPPPPPPPELAHTLVGTIGYIAPEVMNGAAPTGLGGTRGYDPFAADTWALGVFIYEALVGVPPFGGPDANPYIITSRATRPDEELAFPDGLEDVAGDACRLIRALLHPDPTQRPTIHQLHAGDEAVPGVAWVANGGGWGWDALRTRSCPSPILVRSMPGFEVVHPNREVIHDLLEAASMDHTLPSAFGEETFKREEEGGGEDGAPPTPPPPPAHGSRRASATEARMRPYRLAAPSVFDGKLEDDGASLEFSAV